MGILLLFLSILNIFIGFCFNTPFEVKAFNFFASGFAMCGAFHSFLNYLKDRRK